MKKIILRGYYGFGNLGDDILMLSAYKIASRIFPYGDFYISTESSNPFYIKNLLGDIPIISNQSKFHADVTIHGGGGIYFDFEHGNVGNWLLNRFVAAIGYGNFARLYAFYRKLRGTTGVVTDHRIGLGIGVGTFTNTSRKFYASILTLSTYDFLFVRDKISLKNIEAYNFDFPVRLSTDIAFGLPYDLPAIPPPEKRSIGIILRDWKYDDHAHVEAVMGRVPELRSLGLEPVFFAFNANTDKQLIDRVKGNYRIEVWDPNNRILSEYLMELGKCEVIVTSRAHGAVLGACIGVPGICLEIEPKLRTIAMMLPQSYELADFRNTEWLDKIEEMMDAKEHFRECTRTDVLHNRKILDDSLKELKMYLEKLDMI